MASLASQLDMLTCLVFFTTEADKWWSIFESSPKPDYDKCIEKVEWTLSLKGFIGMPSLGTDLGICFSHLPSFCRLPTYSGAVFKAMVLRTDRTFLVKKTLCLLIESSTSFLHHTTLTFLSYVFFSIYVILIKRCFIHLYNDPCNGPLTWINHSIN